MFTDNSLVMYPGISVSVADFAAIRKAYEETFTLREFRAVAIIENVPTLTRWICSICSVPAIFLLEANSPRSLPKAGFENVAR